VRYLKFGQLLRHVGGRLVLVLKHLYGFLNLLTKKRVQSGRIVLIVPKNDVILMRTVSQTPPYVVKNSRS
jgi:hypothetical protein